MSIKYIPVQWNKNKWRYDIVMLSAVVALLCLFIFVGPFFLDYEKTLNAQVLNARAFGLCAFIMLSTILCIGPMARLDRRFLPLLYNRRHFGVMTVFVALTHASYIINWYFAFSKSNKYEALLFSNTSYGQITGFPFEIFGVLAITIMLVLAATSHDFWMKFLTPPIWKRIHYMIYFAYAFIVAHVSFGILQDQQNHVFTVIFLVCVFVVLALHIAAGLKERFSGDPIGLISQTGFIKVCKTIDMEEGFARIALLPSGDRVAVFLQGGKLSAISNACAHQNGPLGEGKVIRCLVTCPWHGFQYDVTNGRSPAPFTETIPTYNLELDGEYVMVNPTANPPGTFVEPVPLPTDLKGKLV
ncbi:MAG: Rieske 2Fe-2S domain-containing protein [Halopseudomonas aestusnigri]